ncbi:MAG: hypothetical protein ACXV9R_00780 [Methylobacter sp.]
MIQAAAIHESQMFQVKKILPGSFDAEKHFYSRALNAHLHPVISHFMGLSKNQIAGRFCQLQPNVDRDALDEVLSYQPHFMHWAGTDLFLVVNARGQREMMVIETNSSPSGQKSVPRHGWFDDFGGYRTLIETVLLPLTQTKSLPAGALAVFYDKNEMEASGYASVMAEIFGEPVYLTPFFDNDPHPPVRFTDGVAEVNVAGTWIPIRAALRYVTQKPWDRIPLHTRSLIFNPIIACLAGGRNKATAALSYETYNRELSGSGLAICMPETVIGAKKEDIPRLIRDFDNMAVVKVPYTNAGQDVFTITNATELNNFMEEECSYDRFLVQRLIGSPNWRNHANQLGHVGTVPDQAGRCYVADLRFMVGAGKDRFIKIAGYSRKARLPLTSQIPSGIESWEILGTNLSVKLGQNQWKSEDNRLLLMDHKDFPKLGLGLDDLIKAFVQTVLSSVAIDRMACSIMEGNQASVLSRLSAVVNDDKLLEEIKKCRQSSDFTG